MGRLLLLQLLRRGEVVLSLKHLPGGQAWVSGTYGEPTQQPLIGRWQNRQGVRDVPEQGVPLPRQGRLPDCIESQAPGVEFSPGNLDCWPVIGGGSKPDCSCRPWTGGKPACVSSSGCSPAMAASGRPRRAGRQPTAAPPAWAPGVSYRCPGSSIALDNADHGVAGFPQVQRRLERANQAYPGMQGCHGRSS